LRASGCKVLLTPDDQANDSIVRLVRPLIEGKIDQLNLDRKFLHKDGTTIWAHNIVQTIRDKAGNFRFLISMVIDFTEKKKMEESLRLSEEKFSKAFKTSPDAININRMSDGVFLDVNEGFTILAGYTREETIGRSSLPGGIGVWAYKEDRDRLVQGLTEHGKVTGLEAPFRHRDGRIIYGMMSAAIIELNGEKCILSITRDMTEKKIQADALCESEKKYRELTNDLPLCVYESDLKGNIIFINGTGTKMFGYSQADIQIGLNISRIVAPADRERAWANLQQSATLEDASQNEYTAIRKDGRRVPVLIMTHPVQKEGTHTGYRGIVIDITERKQMESVIQNSQKLESLGVLAGGIAHDFNNMLTGLFGYLDLARTGLPDSSEVKAYLSNAFSVFARAKALTQQLLTFSKGGDPLKERISIPVLLRQNVYFALSGSNLKVTFGIPEDLWECDADAQQIGQVIDNIIINARQAMPLGGTINVSAENVNETGVIPVMLARKKYVRIAIQDRGIGIPPDVLPRIFDPFFTTKQEGSGLGLATVYSIIKKHEGHIFAESDQEKGTLFTFYLPASPQQDEYKNAIPRTLPLRTKVKILLLDDEIIVREVATALFNALDCDITQASDGKEALELYKRAFSAKVPFDLVILDLTIPGGMGGKDTFEEIRKLDPGVKAVASSGYSDDPIMADPTEYGFKAKLNKPYVKNDLLKLLNTLFT
jgi:two-component system, cell cycle sensor histidine kinase and response regulator CckA